jgi:molybdopterin molybdotransferase
MSLTARFSCLSDYDPDALSVEQARAFIRSQLTPLRTRQRLALRSALGRVLASDVIAPVNVPAHDNSAMDGYALRHADLSSSGETRLRVAGTALAGQTFAGSMAAGECVRIMTGAPLPVGSDVVVMQEVVERRWRQRRDPAGQRRGQNIRRAGEDLAAGQAGARCRTTDPPGGTRSDRFAGLCRGQRLPPPACRLFLDRRRTVLDRYAAGLWRGL